MSKFLKLEVSRSESTDLYLKVPDDFVPSWATLGALDLQKAAHETTDSYEWEAEGRIEVQGFGEVSADEALQYQTFDVETGKRATQSAVVEVEK